MDKVICFGGGEKGVRPKAPGVPLPAPGLLWLPHLERASALLGDQGPLGGGGPPGGQGQASLTQGGDVVWSTDPEVSPGESLGRDVGCCALETC